MEKMAISKFKATCLAVLEQVRKTGKPVQVTRFGEPVAEIVPPSPPPRPDGWMGCMQGSGRIVGDIVAPAAEESDWEALGGPDREALGKGDGEGLGELDGEALDD